jgi:hypothetical protein
MTDLALTPTWHSLIHEIGTTELLQGGADGVDNLPHKQLGENIEWLDRRVRAALGVAADRTLIYMRCVSALELVAGDYFVPYTDGPPRSAAWKTGGSTLSSPACLPFFIPATSGTIVGASIMIAASGDTTPTTRPVLALTRTDMTGGGASPSTIASVEDTGTPYAGVRNLILSYPTGLAVGLTTQCALEIRSAANSGGISNMGLSVFAPFVFIQPDA